MTSSVLMLIIGGYLTVRGWKCSMSSTTCNRERGDAVDQRNKHGALDNPRLGPRSAFTMQRATGLRRTSTLASSGRSEPSCWGFERRISLGFTLITCVSPQLPFALTLRNADRHGGDRASDQL